MFKALATTVRHLPTRKITVQYPEEREQLPERSRGLFRVVIDPATDQARCRACTLCESNCPAQVIRVNYESSFALPVPNEARISDARLAAQPAVDLGALEPVVAEFRAGAGSLVTALHDVQHAYGYLPRAALCELSLQTGVSLSQIYGVATFYGQFRLSPAGAHVVSVCHGAGCLLAGAAEVTEALQGELGIDLGSTTADKLFTLESVACLGACLQAPVMRVGDREYGNLTADGARQIIRDLMHEVGGVKG
jgi:NADH-quinone oxidoreductase subunit E